MNQKQSEALDDAFVLLAAMLIVAHNPDLNPADAIYKGGLLLNEASSRGYSLANIVERANGENDGS